MQQVYWIVEFGNINRFPHLQVVSSAGVREFVKGIGSTSLIIVCDKVKWVLKCLLEMQVDPFTRTTPKSIMNGWQWFKIGRTSASPADRSRQQRFCCDVGTAAAAYLSLVGGCQFSVSVAVWNPIPEIDDVSEETGVLGAPPRSPLTPWLVLRVVVVLGPVANAPLSCVSLWHLQVGFWVRASCVLSNGASGMSSLGQGAKAPLVTTLKLVEVPQALQDGEKFIKWDEVRNFNHN